MIFKNVGIALMMAIGLAACNRAPEPQRGALEGAAIGGPFTLINQDGKPTRWSDFAGKYRIVYFGYTFCPDVCPVDLQRIMQGYAAFAKASPAQAAKIQPIFITVDPQRDTPSVLKSYVSAIAPQLVGLTGTEQQIAQVTKSFAVVYGKEGAANGSSYLVSHSRTPYLFGPDGSPIALVPVDDPATPVQEGTPEEIVAFLRQWVK